MYPLHTVGVVVAGGAWLDAVATLMPTPAASKTPNGIVIKAAALRFMVSTSSTAVFPDFLDSMTPRNGAHGVPWLCRPCGESGWGRGRRATPQSPTNPARRPREDPGPVAWDDDQRPPVDEDMLTPAIIDV